MPDQMPNAQLDAARTALAFLRAFATGDGPGATVMLSSQSVEEIPQFVSALASFTLSALRVGDVPPDAFFDGLASLIES